MKKPIYLRIFGFLLLYVAVLTGLVLIQFSKRSAFTLRVSDMVISGNYREIAEAAANSALIPIQENIEFFYGGMEFCLSSNEGFSLVFSNGTSEEIYPEFMAVSNELVVFYCTNGVRIEFSTRFSGGEQELRINAVLGAPRVTLELPFKPFRSSRISDGGNGRLIIIADKQRYSFGSSVIDMDRRRLILSSENPFAFYQVVPEQREFNPRDFVLAQAAKSSYAAEIARWRDQSVSLWGTLINGNPDEDMVVASIAEAAQRGMFKSAVSSVPSSFLSGNQRTYVSSAFLGRLDAGLRSLLVTDREKLSRLSRLINEKSSDIFLEPHVVDYFYSHGTETFIAGVTTIVRDFDPAGITLNVAPGILENWCDWKRLFPGTENPFERLVDQTCFVISRSVKKDGSRVLVVEGNNARTEFNVRLGQALALYGEASNHEDWAAVGRSMVLSVLSLINQTGTIPAALTLSENGLFTENNAGTPVSSARLYRIINPVEYYPRATALTTAMSGMWIWTASSAVSAVYENDVLDISVAFPLEESHYVMICGVRPFRKIQIYDMDYRTDPQFERYDSSGWAYSASERTLMVKLKHRSAVEHIKIFYD